MCPLASPRPFHSLLIVLLLTLILAFPARAQTGSNPGPEKAGSVVLININKTKQEMTVFVDGIEKYHWPVSTGRAGYSTPSGTYTATSMNKIWYSKQWDNSPMPHSIFFIKDGHAIHGSYEVKNLGKPVSHGCVRISPQNATMLYALVQENGLDNTQVVLTGVTPGGEFKFATQHNAIYYDTNIDPIFIDDPAQHEAD
jgi:L,D-transpeptidase catalytic domain